MMTCNFDVPRSMVSSHGASIKYGLTTLQLDAHLKQYFEHRITGMADLLTPEGWFYHNEADARGANAHCESYGLLLSLNGEVSPIQKTVNGSFIMEHLTTVVSNDINHPVALCVKPGFYSTMKLRQFAYIHPEGESDPCCCPIKTAIENYNRKLVENDLMGPWYIMGYAMIM